MPPGSHNGSDRSGAGGGRGSHQGRGSAQDKAENNGGEFGPGGYQGRGGGGNGAGPSGPSLSKSGVTSQGAVQEREVTQKVGAPYGGPSQEFSPGDRDPITNREYQKSDFPNDFPTGDGAVAEHVFNNLELKPGQINPVNGRMVAGVDENGRPTHYVGTAYAGPSQEFSPEDRDPITGHVYTDRDFTGPNAALAQSLLVGVTAETLQTVIDAIEKAPNPSAALQSFAKVAGRLTGPLGAASISAAIAAMQGKSPEEIQDAFQDGLTSGAVGWGLGYALGAFVTGAALAAGVTIATPVALAGAFAFGLGWALTDEFTGFTEDWDLIDRAIGWLDPVILDLSNDDFQLIDLSESAAFFDYDADEYLENIGWVSGEDGILAIDLNGSGTIDEAAEFVFAAETETEDTDLEALAELYDSNGDGVLNAEDESWGDFRVWQDWNGDGQSQEGEVSTLEELNISEIGLVSDGVEEDIAGNIVHGRATFTREDGTAGDVGDLSLKASAFGYRETEDGIEIGDGDALVLEGSEDQNLDLSDIEYDGLVTGGGNDTLSNSSGSGGFLSAGAGDDIIVGGDEGDWLSGDEGADTILGGSGHDTLFVDAEDTIDGGAGFDVVLGQGEEGLSIDLGATNTEAVYGAEGNDDLRAGNAQHVTIDGGAGDDQVIGGDGNDLLSGGDGADTLRGGAGDDTLVVDENDDFNGGAGEDRVIFMGDADLDINITDYEIEIFNSGGGDDIIRTDQAHEAAIDGGEGDDTIFGGWGDDWLSGGHGSDSLLGGYGDDTYLFGRGDGSDTIRDFSHNTRTDTIYDLYSDGSKRNVRHRTVDIHEDAGNDRILFGADIDPDDLMIKADGQDIVIALKDPDNPDASFDQLSDQLRLVNWQDSRDRIEGVEFSNGTALDLTAMLGNLGFVVDGTILDVGAAMAAKLGDLAEAVGEDGIGLAGASADEVLSGGEGDDVIAAGGGDDFVTGAAGDDQLYGQDGDDIIYGGEGSDLLDGGAGDDLLLSDGNDTLRGGAGTDTVKFSNDDGVQFDLSDAEVESVLGSLGDDELSALGLEEAIYINGGAGNDTLSTGAGADRLLGGSGDDILDGGFGDDMLDGGAGYDRFIGNEGADTMLGGAGQDIVDYSGSDQGVELSLETGGTSGDAAGDSFDGIESVIGTHQDDVIAGDGADNTLDAGAGDDSLFGQGGDDHLLAGDGDDILDGGQGDDILDGGTGDDHLTGGMGADRLSGGEGNDVLDAGEGVDFVDAGAGDDIIIGRGDGDVINGGAGDDTLDYSGSENGVRLDMSDTVGYSTEHVEDSAHNIENVVGSGGKDDLAGGASDDRIVGGGGDDVLSGRLGDDALSGDTGNDTLLGQQGDDVLSGGKGDDVLSGGSGDDTLTGGTGDNLLFGGEGQDEAVFDGSVDDYSFARDGDGLIVSGQNGTTRVNQIETIRFDDAVFDVEDLLADDDMPVVSETRQRRDEQYQTALAASVASAVALGGLASTYDNTAQAADVIQAVAEANDADSDNIWLVTPVEAGTEPDIVVAGSGASDLLSDASDNANGVVGFADNEQVLSALGALAGEREDPDSALIAKVFSEDDFVAVEAGPDQLLSSTSPSSASDASEGIDTANTPDADAGTKNTDVLEDEEAGSENAFGIAFENAAPKPVADHVFSFEDREIRIRISDLLANDRDREGNTLRIDQILSVGNGVASISGDYIVFQPAPDFYGDASVRYRLHDGFGNYVETVLNIHLSPVNDEPEITTRDARTHYEQAVDISTLISGTDRDGDNLFIDLRDASGLGHFTVDGVAVPDGTTVRVSLEELARVKYIPSHNLNTAETIIARTFDGELYSDWTSFTVTADNTLLGSDGNDVLSGGTLGDILDGFDGDDQLNGSISDDLLTGRGGNDTLSGGDGDDTLYGGDGDDTLIGGAGTNTLFAGNGNDTLEIENVDDLDRVFAGTGRDRLVIHNVSDLTLDLAAHELEEIVAGSGNDFLYSSGSDDLYIDAGAGNDVLQGGDGNDTLIGGAGKDRIEGGAGDDIIEVGLGDNLADIDGGSGNDTLTVSDGVDIIIDMTGTAVENVIGGAGAETVTDLCSSGTNISLGAGNDTVVAGTGADILDGGTGFDTLDYSQSTSAVQIDLSGNVVSGGNAEGDTITGFEHVIDTIFDDTIVGDAQNNTLHSMSGNDMLTGGDGADTFSVDVGATASGTVRVRDFTPTKGDIFSLSGIGGAALIAAATNALANQTMDDDGNVSITFPNGREVIFEGLGEPLTADMIDAPVVVVQETISDEQSGEMSIAVSLSRAVEEDVTLDFSLIDKTGSVASDLKASTGQITVPAGETSAKAVVSTNVDQLIEGTEAFDIKIDAVSSASFASASLASVSGTAYLVDQKNTANQVEQSLYGLDETQLKQSYAEGGDTSIGVLMSGYIDTNHPVYFNRVVASVNAEMDAGGASFVDFDYSFYIANNYHWTNGTFYSYYRFQTEDGQWTDWSSGGAIRSYGGDWQSINFSGNYRINFADELPDDAQLQVRVDYYHGVVSGRGSYQLGGGYLDIGTMHTETLVSNDAFMLGDIDEDGHSDIAYYDHDADLYRFRYGEIGATTSEAFDLQNDTEDQVVSVIGGEVGAVGNLVLVAAGARIYVIEPSVSPATLALSEQPFVTFDQEINSVVLGVFAQAGDGVLAVGLGDEAGLSAIKLISPSSFLDQSDVDNAKTLTLPSGYTSIVNLGDTDGDGISEIGLQGDGGIVRIPSSILSGSEASVILGSTGEDELVSGAASEMLAGLAGDDIYKFTGDFGNDVIDNTESGIFDDDGILFGADVSPENLWFSQVGDDLLLEVMGRESNVTISDWYGGSSGSKLDYIELSTGERLLTHEVEQLVNIMSAFDRSGDEQVISEVLPQDIVEGEVEQLWSA